MVRGSFQRAAVAILLVGMMIAPLGICLQRSSKSAHSCCMEQKSSQTLHCVRTNCCVVRTQLPAMLAKSTLPGPSRSEAVHEYMVCVTANAVDEHSAVALIPPQSPPPGAFILRI